jgi:GNAT superfamily N-acetyltransferase
MCADIVLPLTPERWPDIERLFGNKGACAGCWCQYWRQRGPDWKARLPASNRLAFKDQVEQGPPPGLIGYADGQAVAWCQIGPRERYARIMAAPSKQAIDTRPTWLLTCFFVARAQRGRGWMKRLVEAALAFAQAEGAECVEAWPVAGGKAVAAPFAYVGHAPTLELFGFRAIDVGGGTGRTFRRHRLEFRAIAESRDPRRQATSPGTILDGGDEVSDPGG